MNKRIPVLCAIGLGAACSGLAAVEVTNVSDTKDVGLHRIFTWTDTATPGTLTVLDDAGRDVDILVVGGGGAGGFYRGGGGGGGGVVTQKVHLAKGVYTITIGAGGIPDMFTSEQYDSYNAVPTPSATTCGGSSTFVGDGVSIEAFGGGGGGTSTTINNKWSGEDSDGLPGGCGGGSAGGGKVAAVGSQGGNGGIGGGSGGGGGGGAAPEDGAASTLGTGADGGAGFVSSITGLEVSYGGGGGAGASQQWTVPAAGGAGGGGAGGAWRYPNTEDVHTPPVAGVDGLGGGGGGGLGYNSWTVCGGAKGGSGTVIVKVYDEARVEPDTTIPGVANLWGVGSIKTIEKDVVCTWTNTAEAGAFEVLSKKGLDVEMLLVGGGGAGGFYRGGGGGGGGVVTQKVHLAKGSYIVLVGRGGIADRFNAEDYSSKGNMAPPSSLDANGGNSEFKNDSVNFVARGGGAGGTASNANNHWHGEDSNGSAGGCGGGSAGGGGVAAIGSQGGNGGISTGDGGAGGGGAVPENGFDVASGTAGSAGGAGLVSSITGQEVIYGGGGGGGASNQWTDPAVGGIGGGGAGGAWRNPNAQETHTLPVAGEDGLGGGGGGGLGYNWATCGGANGGRGVVVLRFCKHAASGFLLFVK